MHKFILAFLCGGVLWSQGLTIRTLAGSNAVAEQGAAQTAPLAVMNGANVLITASYLFGAEDLPQVTKSLKRLA